MWSLANNPFYTELHCSTEVSYQDTLPSCCLFTHLQRTGLENCRLYVTLWLLILLLVIQFIETYHYRRTGKFNSGSNDMWRKKGLASRVYSGSYGTIWRYIRGKPHWGKADIQLIVVFLFTVAQTLSLKIGWFQKQHYIVHFLFTVRTRVNLPLKSQIHST